MKGILKNFVTLCLFSVVLCCVSCTQKSKVEQLVEEASKQCPMDLGLVGKLSSVAYADGVLTLELCINEDIVPIGLFADEEYLKSSSIGSLSVMPENFKNIMSELVKEKASMVFRYVGDKSKKSYELKISCEELEAGLNSSMNDMDYEKQLDAQLAVGSEQYPLDMGNGVVLDSVSKSDEFVIYHYSIDESYSTIAEIDKNSANIKTMLLTNIQQNINTMRLFLVCCVNTSRGIEYRYCGKDSGDKFSFYFSKANIEELLN